MKLMKSMKNDYSLSGTMDFNYDELGLRVGLEVHQQLDTKAKLFCKCSTKLYEGSFEGVARIERYLRVTKSEIGEVDPAAVFEFMKGKKIIYLAPSNHTCGVELDEEPPHELNREALEIALGIAMGFKSKVVDEVHVMRKIVVDGSNTTGFQRTAIIALGGELDDDEGIVRIQTICLEEDSARKIDDLGDAVVYNLDRLGIPLIEIATAPDIKSPEQALRVASKIGLMLRLTNKVKRGLGTIRQDLNISIKDGAKIEIKGVQRLELLPKVIMYEVLRQLKLLEIKNELIRRGVREEDIQDRIYDVTNLFRDTKSRLISGNVSKGYKVYAACLKGFKGLLKLELQPGRRFGTELSDYARQWGGTSGIIHTDELPAYGISHDEVLELYKYLGANIESDAIVLTVGPEDRCINALRAVINRAKEALRGIPKETRAANEDGTTRYMRPQPGAARMYPETDVPPVKIDERIIKEALKYVPKDPGSVYDELVRKYSLSQELSRQLLRSPYITYFYELVQEFGDEIPPQYVASLLTIHIGSLRNEGVPVENLSIEVIKHALNALRQGRLSRDGVINVLREYALDNRRPISELIEKYSTALDIKYIYDAVHRVIDSNIDELVKRKDKAFNIVMGRVMNELRGKADGKLVAEVVKKVLNERLGHGY